MQKMFRLFLSSVLLVLGIGQSSHALIINGDFSSGLTSWHTGQTQQTDYELLYDQPTTAISIDSNEIALFNTQGYSSNIIQMTLSQDITIENNADTFSFDIAFKRGGGDSTDPCPGEPTTCGSPDYFQVSFLGNNNIFQAFLGVDAAGGYYDPTTLDSLTLQPLISSDGFEWYRFVTGIRSLAGVSGTLYFDLFDYADGYYSTAKVDNVMITTTPVPEPSTILLLGSGLIIFIGRRIKRFRN